MKLGDPYRLQIGDGPPQWRMNVPVYMNGTCAFTCTRTVVVMPELAQFYEGNLRFLQEEERNRPTGIARYYMENPEAE